MKILGQKSVASTLKHIITWLFYLEFLLLLLLPLVFLGEKGLRYTRPVTLSQSTLQASAKADNPQITDFAFRERPDAEPGTRVLVLSFEDNSMGRKFLQTLHNIITFGLIILITYWLKLLFTRLAGNQPFATENAKWVKWIGWAVLLLPFYDVVESFLSGWYTQSTVELSGARFDFYDFGFDIRSLLTGVLLLLISEILKRGNEYQSDSESIV